MHAWVICKPNRLHTHTHTHALHACVLCLYRLSIKSKFYNNIQMYRILFISFKFETDFAFKSSIHREGLRAREGEIIVSLLCYGSGQTSSFMHTFQWFRTSTLRWWCWCLAMVAVVMVYARVCGVRACDLNSGKQFSDEIGQKKISFNELDQIGIEYTIPFIVCNPHSIWLIRVLIFIIIYYWYETHQRKSEKLIPREKKRCSNLMIWIDLDTSSSSSIRFHLFYFSCSIPNRNKTKRKCMCVCVFGWIRYSRYSSVKQQRIININIKRSLQKKQKYEIEIKIIANVE